MLHHIPFQTPAEHSEVRTWNGTESKIKKVATRANRALASRRANFIATKVRNIDYWLPRPQAVSFLRRTTNSPDQ